MNVEMKHVSQLAQTQQDGNSRERNSKFVEENVTGQTKNMPAQLRFEKVDLNKPFYFLFVQRIKWMFILNVQHHVW